MAIQIENKHTKPPFRVGNTRTSVVADDDTGLQMLGATGRDAVAYYGGNLVAESCSPGNAQFIVDACNFYWRCLEIGASMKRPYRRRDPEKVVPTAAVMELVRRFDAGAKYELVDGDQVYEVSAMQTSTWHPDHVMLQFFGDNAEWIDESPVLLREVHVGPIVTG